MMNNADFLSDAVALDLGKSGVKVAETLEIQVGEEWWRLINAADVSTVRAYQGRRFQDPIISDGELHLAGVAKNFQLQFPAPFEGYKTPDLDHQPAVAYMDGTGQFRYASVWIGIDRLVKMAVYDGDRVLKLSGTGSYTDSAYGKMFCSVIDTVNARALAVVIHGTSATPLAKPSFYSCDLTDGTVSRSGAITDLSIVPHRVRSFLEAPGVAYSLFIGATLRVKKKEFTAGEDYRAAGIDLLSTSSAVVISGAENFGTSAAIFYSRWHESVAVFWYNSVTKTACYALESESYGTVHTLPDFTNLGEWSVDDLGNFAIPMNGEFLIASLVKQPSGTLTKPVGWSWPENFTFLSAHGIGDGKGTILGYVGGTLYRVEINLQTKAILRVGSSSSYLAGYGQHARLVKKTATRELYVCHFFESSSYRHDKAMVCWDTVNNVMAWVFGSAEYTSSTYFPRTASMPPYIHIRPLSPELLLIFRYYYDGITHWKNWYVLDMETLVSCADIAAVRALLTATGVFEKNHGKIAAGHYPGIDSSTIMESDSPDYYRIPMDTSNGMFSAEMRFNKSTYDFTYVEMTRDGGGIGSTVPDMYPIAPQKVYDQAGILRGAPCTVLDDPVTDDLLLTPEVRTNKMYKTTLTASAYNAVLVGRSSGQLPYSDNALTSDRCKGIPINTPNSRVWWMASGTKAAMFGISYEGNSFGWTGTTYTLPFSAVRLLHDYQSGCILALSNVSAGEMSWAEFHATQRLPRKFIAVANTGDFYDVEGMDVLGGFQKLNFCGRAILGTTSIGKQVVLDMGAELTEGMGDGYSGGGGGSGGSGGFAGYIYTYQDSEFTPYPFAREGIRAELSNISKTTKITLPETQDNLIRGMLAAGTDFRGSRCILRRVFPDHIDEPGSDIVLLDGYIQDWSYVPGKKGIAFSVSKTLIDVGAQFPKRLMNMGCSHVFKGSRCRYLGEEGRCLKTRAFCTSLGNLNQFGGFPWVAARQRRVMWK